MYVFRVQYQGTRGPQEQLPRTTLSRRFLGHLTTREQNLGTGALDLRCQESVREGVCAHIMRLQGDNSILPHCCPNGLGASDENEDRM